MDSLLYLDGAADDDDDDDDDDEDDDVGEVEQKSKPAPKLDYAALQRAGLKEATKLTDTATYKRLEDEEAAARERREEEAKEAEEEEARQKAAVAQMQASHHFARTHRSHHRLPSPHGRGT